MLFTILNDTEDNKRNDSGKRNGIDSKDFTKNMR